MNMDIDDIKKSISELNPKEFILVKVNLVRPDSIYYIGIIEPYYYEGVIEILMDKRSHFSVDYDGPVIEGIWAYDNKALDEVAKYLQVNNQNSMNFYIFFMGSAILFKKWENLINNNIKIAKHLHKMLKKEIDKDKDNSMFYS